ncbi:MAG: LexA repressor [Microgenomates group bacterium GW2011_GWA2_44_7]|nr:MAG: LexA repressor [Microgenomates group bacterium GW2011_GWA2_44_7]
MPVTLYRRQRQILDFISLYIQKNGFSPTLQEIAASLGVKSLATVHEHLATMVKKGVLKRYEGAVRGIQVVGKNIKDSITGIELPILGYIAAGQPIEAYTDPNATTNIPSSMISGKKRAFVLQVKGTSMIDSGILPDDYVVVEQTETAHNGEIVVALLDNGFATLKRFFKEATRIRFAVCVSLFQ